MLETVGGGDGSIVMYCVAVDVWPRPSEMVYENWAGPR